MRGVVWFQTFMYKCGGIFTSVRLGAAAGGAAQLALGPFASVSAVFASHASPWPAARDTIAGHGLLWHGPSCACPCASVQA